MSTVPRKMLLSDNLFFNKVSFFPFHSHVCKGGRKVAMSVSYSSMCTLLCMVILADALKVVPLYLRRLFWLTVLQDTSEASLSCRWYGILRLYLKGYLLSCRRLLLHTWRERFPCTQACYAERSSRLQRWKVFLEVSCPHHQSCIY